jgi:pyruvate/2-oxoglutarate/acetoin dehydrogenase E1 component
MGRSITLADQIKDMTTKSKDSLDEFGEMFEKRMKAMTKVEAIETKTRIRIQKTYANSLSELSNSFKSLGFLSDDMKIAAIIAEKAFEYLDAPISRVGSPFTPVGFNKILEKAILPDTNRIYEAAKKAIEY